MTEGLLKSLLVSSIILGLGACAPKNQEQSIDNETGATESIVAGTKVLSSDYAAASTVALYIDFNGRFLNFCTGSLIGKDLVLTAGHCIADFAEEVGISQEELKSKISIGFGTAVAKSKTDSRVVFRSIKNLQVNPQYRVGSVTSAESIPMYDVTLIKLSAPAPAKAKVVQILTDSSELVPGKPILLAGFGLIDGLFQKQTSQMMKVTVQIDNPALTSAQFTYKVVARKSACSGDSGGPAFLIDRNKVVRLAGVTSWGDNYCMQMGAYTSVPAVESWIRTAQLSL